MLHYTVNQLPHWACEQFGHSEEPSDDQVSKDVNFAWRIHPAAQSDISEQQWSLGFTMNFHCV